MSKPKRPSADETRAKILQAAKSVFLQHGFDGAKTSAIVREAGVHSNLVFHHFANKETLWLKVKEVILDQCAEPPRYDLTSAKTYFASLLDYRFQLYRDNPELARLVQWQSVTEKSEALIGENFASPFHWLDDMRLLQNRGELMSTIDPKLMMLFILYSSYAPFMQSIIALSATGVAQYKRMILNACLQQFGVKNDT